MATAAGVPKLRDDELLITRAFNAPRALVWRMWEDEDHRRRWWGPEGFAVLSLESDFRPGGLWRVHMRSDSYGESWSSGVYREIRKPDRIVFTFAWEEGFGEPTETLVTVTLEERDGKTIQHFHQAPFRSVEIRDGHVGGWNSLFNRQAAYAAAMPKGEK